MEKSTSQKGLKVVSIITIIIAVLTILASLMILVGGGVAGSMGVDTNDQDAIMLGGLAMILGVFPSSWACST